MKVGMSVTSWPDREVSETLLHQESTTT